MNTLDKKRRGEADVVRTLIKKKIISEYKKQSKNSPNLYSELNINGTEK